MTTLSKDHPVLVFHAADDAWNRELIAVFGPGRRYVKARYGDAGQGKPGTLLRKLYEEREVARRNYDVFWRRAPR